MKSSIMLVVALLLLSGAGCSREPAPPVAQPIQKDQPPPQQAPAAQPPQPVQSVAANSPLPLPAALPKDVPVYPEAVVKSSSLAPQGRSLQFVYEAKIDKDALQKFYEDACASAGWKLAPLEGQDPPRLRLEKEQREVYVDIMPRDEGVQCRVVVMLKRE